MKLTGHQYNGVINVNKARGMTSHDVVSALRRILSMKKIGHTGTLDPDVSGVLPICVGKATRIAEYLQEYDKTYEGRIKLASQTDTEDHSGKVINKSDYIPSEEEIEKVRIKYLGEQDQTPPMYSAVHYEGKRLYDLARQGKIVERESRKIYIESLKFFNYNYPYLDFNCTCSKGTYMRTLINDVGIDLGSYAHLYSMKRTSVECFSIENSFTLDGIEEMLKINDYSFIIDMDKSLCGFDKINLPNEYFDRLVNGVKINVDITETSDPSLIYCDDIFIGIGHVEKIEGFNKLVLNKMLYME